MTASSHPRPGSLGVVARVVAVVALACAGLALGPAVPAWAHASMTGSSPGAGDRLEALPSEVVFEFSADMDPTAYVVVTGPDGASVATGDPVVDGRTITQRLGEGGDGGYLMAVKAVSTDGHAVTGRVEFVVGDQPLPAPAASSPESDPSTGTTTGTATAGAPAAPAGPSDVRGRPPWVWAVGGGCLLAAIVLWGLGSRAPREERASA